MDNLLLFSSKSASLVPRYFNDPALMIAKQGVSFSGVIKGKVGYMDRSQAYTQQKSTPELTRAHPSSVRLNKKNERVANSFYSLSV